MTALKVLLVLGAGKNIGESLAHSFKAAGYKIVLVSRSAADGQTTSEGYLTLKADLSKPATIPSLFESVKAKLGGPPTVVVYNAASLPAPTDPTNPFTIPIESLESGLALMNTSAYIAAREAVAGFDSLPKDAPKAFLYTGNALAAITVPVVPYVSLGIGKSTASYWIGAASQIYKEKGYKFFFPDERTASGAPVGGDVSGSAAASFYLKLVEEENDIPWFATFVDGKGFVDFPDSRRV